MKLKSSEVGFWQRCVEAGIKAGNSRFAVENADMVIEAMRQRTGRNEKPTVIAEAARL